MEGLPSGAGAGVMLGSFEGIGDSDADGPSLLGPGAGVVAASGSFFSGSTVVVSFLVGSGAVAGPGLFFAGAGSRG